MDPFERWDSPHRFFGPYRLRERVERVHHLRSLVQAGLYPADPDRLAFALLAHSRMRCLIGETSRLPSA